MGEYYNRSKSYVDGRMDMENYYIENANGWGKPTNIGASNSSNNVGFQELRCYSASYATSATIEQQQVSTQMPKELKKGKSVNASSKAAWLFGDPELQRKRRVAGYKAYGVEGKLKRSFTRSFRWLKDRLF